MCVCDTYGRKKKKVTIHDLKASHCPLKVEIPKSSKIHVASTPFSTSNNTFVSHTLDPGLKF